MCCISAVPLWPQPNCRIAPQLSHQHECPLGAQVAGLQAGLAQKDAQLGTLQQHKAELEKRLGTKLVRALDRF